MKKLFITLSVFMLVLISAGMTQPSYATSTSNQLPGGKNYIEEANIDLSSSSFYTIDPIAVKPNTTYTFVIPRSDQVIQWIEIYGDAQYYYSEMYIDNPIVNNWGESGLEAFYITFTTHSAETVVNLEVGMGDISIFRAYNGFYWQLEEGSSPTSYATYIPPGDTTPPVFYGTSIWYSNVENPDSFATVLASITADDETDGNLTSSIIVDSDGYTGNETTVGIYSIVLKVYDAAGNSAQKIVEVRVVDIDLPVINLTGSSTTYVEYGSTYSEPGATVSDNYYTGLTATITGSVDSNTLGTYYRYYNVTDPSGNVANQVIRTVVVRDTTAPEITLNGASTVYVEYGSTYSELGASGTDTYDGAVTVNTSGTVNNSVLGTYTISYTATDSSGNNAVALQRTVIVRDTTPPVLTLNGASTIYVEFGDTYSELGAAWTDSYDGSGSASVTGAVNVGVLGTYTLTYNYTDSNGNAASAITRSVIVRDTVAPFLQNNVTNINTYNSLNEAFSAVVSELVVLDTYDGDVTADITYTLNEYATANNIVGVYDVTLQVTDSSGNTFTHSFTITINDDVEPTFSWSSYLLDEATADAMTQDEIRDHINNR